MKAVLDASVFIARFIERDAAHEESMRAIEACRANEAKIFGPAILPAEVAGAISRIKASESAASLALLHLGTYAWLTVRTADTAFIEKAARLAARHALRGADAFYLAVATEQKCPLITLDGELLTRARRQGKRAPTPAPPCKTPPASHTLRGGMNPRPVIFISPVRLDCSHGAIGQHLLLKFG